MADSRPIIVWFRDDLRLSDHPALDAASRTGAPVIGSQITATEARVLGVPDAAVTIEVRRMGGAFGGKETQAAQWAAIAALAARLTRRPCKIRLDRDDDMNLTGKRHDFLADYEVGGLDSARSVRALCHPYGRSGMVTSFSGDIPSASAWKFTTTR